jgi:hypothetical protein
VERAELATTSSVIRHGRRITPANRPLTASTQSSFDGTLSKQQFSSPGISYLMQKRNCRSIKSGTRDNQDCSRHIHDHRYNMQIPFVRAVVSSASALVRCPSAQEVKLCAQRMCGKCVRIEERYMGLCCLESMRMVRKNGSELLSDDAMTEVWQQLAERSTGPGVR